VKTNTLRTLGYEHGMKKLTPLFPPRKPYRTGRLRVSPLHTVHFEECGNPQGRPIVVLHGGPGGGITPNQRRFFDPKKWRIVLFDQRGCGKSTPHAELRENTTWDLVEDTEKLRTHLGIDAWVVFGGSWGSTLALAYAQTYPHRCKGLVLRGIFLLRRSELRWFYQEGASHLFPDAWEHYLETIPKKERLDFITAYYKRLTSRNRQVRLRAARAWSIWEASTSRLIPNDELIRKSGNARFAEAFARIECHYFVNRAFMKSENQLLENIDRIRDIPAIIVQGRYDVVCPMRSAWDLHSVWPEAKLVIVHDAGHSMMEPGIRSALIEATRPLARL